jgi:hypothetical protein
MTASIARLDVPLPVLQDLIARQTLQAASERTHSESDRLAYAYDLVLLDHTELCSTDADYPNWTPGRAA